MLRDAIVIGAGVSGLQALARCLDAGLNALLLERASRVGGLWRQLPDWQDIQLPMQDWALAGTEIDGVTRQHVCDNLVSFCLRHQLEPHIRFGQAVAGLTRDGNGWRVVTVVGDTFNARYVIVASGPHQRKNVPEIERADVTLREYHTSEFERPTSLRGKSVVVNGGGASAFDFIELALRNNAREIHWVYRNVRWMIPSSKPKQARSYLRELAVTQMLGAGVERLNQKTNEWLKARYAYFDVRSLMPSQRFDYRVHQLVPGRPELIESLPRLQRYRGHISSVRGRTVTVNGRHIDADLLVHATGFRIDLDYLGLDRLAGIDTPRQLNHRCGMLCKSLDYPDLFFIGITNAESTSAAPWLAAVAAKSIVAHINGKTRFPNSVVPHNVNHWDLLALLASFDHSNYKPMLWRAKHLGLAMWYRRFSTRPVQV